MTAFAPKAVITMHQRALPDQLCTTPLASTYCNTLINLALAMCYNCDKKGHFALSCLELKDIGDIKEMEEEKMFNKSGKEKP